MCVCATNIFIAESITSGRTLTTHTQPSVRLASDDEEESPLISPSLTGSGDDEHSITPSSILQQDNLTSQEEVHVVVYIIMHLSGHLYHRTYDYMSTSEMRTPHY